MANVCVQLRIGRTHDGADYSTEAAPRAGSADVTEVYMHFAHPYPIAATPVLSDGERSTSSRGGGGGDGGGGGGGGGGGVRFVVVLVFAVVVTEVAAAMLGARLTWLPTILSLKKASKRAYGLRTTITLMRP